MIAPAARIESRYMSIGVLLVILGAVLAGVGFSSAGMTGLAHSYIYAWTFWSSMALGCFSLSLLFHITRGRWGTPILRIFEAGGGPIALGLAFVTLLPVLFVFKESLYSTWLHPAIGDKAVLSKVQYLNEPFWLFRQVFYFAVFIYIAQLMKNWTRKEELTGNKKYSDYRNNLSGAAIVIYFVLLTFMVTDLIMSMDPHWYSTIFGVWFAVGNALAAMGFTVFTVVQFKDRAPFKMKIDDLMRKDFGNLLLMLVMLWAYFSFSQYLIIWSGNLPEFTSFYLNRSKGNFNALGAANILGNFVVPFLLLLSPSVKRHLWLLGLVAGEIFLFRFVDIHYIVVPFLRDQLAPTIGDVGCLSLLGGIWLVQFSLQIKQAPLAVDSHPFETFTPGTPLTEVTDHA